jgi:hypothetical protein
VPTLVAACASVRVVNAITGGMSTIRYASPSRQALAIAAKSGVDPRTAQRALDEGVDVIRTRLVREAIELAATELNIPLATGGRR